MTSECAEVILSFRLDGFNIPSWRSHSGSAFSYCHDPVFNKFDENGFVIANSGYNLEITVSVHSQVKDAVYFKPD